MNLTLIEDDDNEGDDALWIGMEEITEKAQKRKNKDANCSKVPLKKRLDVRGVLFIFLFSELFH